MQLLPTTIVVHISRGMTVLDIQAWEKNHGQEYQNRRDRRSVTEKPWHDNDRTNEDKIRDRTTIVQLESNWTAMTT